MVPPSAAGPEVIYLAFTGPARDTARVIGGLAGAMLVTRPSGDAAGFQVAAASLLAGLAAPTDVPPRV